MTFKDVLWLHVWAIPLGWSWAHVLNWLGLIN